jgi:transposase
MTNARKSYPSDVSDEEWSFSAPYLTLMKPDAPQREDSLRELYNGLRWFVRAGCPWRMMPNDLPPWHAVQQQTQRWLRAGCFETMAEDFRALLRLAACFRRLARDYECLAATLSGYHWLAFVRLMLQSLFAKSA